MCPASPGVVLSGAEVGVWRRAEEERSPVRSKLDEREGYRLNIRATDHDINSSLEQHMTKLTTLKETFFFLSAHNDSAHSNTLEICLCRSISAATPNPPTANVKVTFCFQRHSFKSSRWRKAGGVIHSIKTYAD